MVMWTLRRPVSFGKAFEIMPGPVLVIRYTVIRFYEYLAEKQMTESVLSR